MCVIIPHITIDERNTAFGVIVNEAAVILVALSACYLRKESPKGLRFSIPRLHCFTGQVF